MKLRARLALTLAVVAVPLVAGARWLRADVERRVEVASLAGLARGRMELGGRELCERSPGTFGEPLPNDAPPDAHAAVAGARTAFVARDAEARARDVAPPAREIATPPPRNTRNSAQVAQARGPDREAVRGPHQPDDDALQYDPDPEPDARDRTSTNERPERSPATSARATTPLGIELFAYQSDFTSVNSDAPAFPVSLRRALESGAREAGDVVDTRDGREITAAVRMPWSSGPCPIVLASRRDDPAPIAALDELGFAALLVGALVIAVVVAVGPIERRIRRLIRGVHDSAAQSYRPRVAVEGGDEIGELATAFNAAGGEVQRYIEELEKRERSLRDFVQNTTHDVMIPLTVLQGHLTQIRDVVAAGAMPNRAVVRDALEESHYLASLVQNLVAAARLESGLPDRRHDAFSWNHIVERVVQRHGPIAREREVELDFAAPERDVRAEGDVTLVEQALSNVVHNAVRYNKPGGHVAILLDATGGRFSVRVFDDGPGVAESELEQLAERSFRSDAARARNPDGMGLGLAIAKDVADRHGFSLALRRAETGGLEVEIGGPALAA